ncbi:CBS domain-containing protein [Streptomyces atratus]|uniref:CBS domain-containing protein n=1 Tax=Streptomyces atratus TaxID=1893 RepID=UPI00167017A3|nr:CBS domain-containing protein [Streptomyces atratus]WPW26967.1 CBS domain-containing protein [Streptomyces atratus]GGT33336.1 hypothetical protein GCM10010207_36770 [Streptomyces atratus]
MMHRTVSEVMTRDVSTAAPEASLEPVIRILDHNHVSALPVVDTRPSNTPWTTWRRITDQRVTPATAECPRQGAKGADRLSRTVPGVVDVTARFDAEVPA